LTKICVSKDFMLNDGKVKGCYKNMTEMGVYSKWSQSDIIELFVRDIKDPYITALNLSDGYIPFAIAISA
jgi:hypothetical protein